MGCTTKPIWMMAEDSPSMALTQYFQLVHSEFANSFRIFLKGSCGDHTKTLDTITTTKVGESIPRVRGQTDRGDI